MKLRTNEPKRIIDLKSYQSLQPFVKDVKLHQVEILGVKGFLKPETLNCLANSRLPLQRKFPHNIRNCDSLMTHTIEYPGREISKVLQNFANFRHKFAKLQKTGVVSKCLYCLWGDVSDA